MNFLFFIYLLFILKLNSTLTIMLIKPKIGNLLLLLPSTQMFFHNIENYVYNQHIRLHFI